MITVTQRPEKDLYENNPPETYEEPYGRSYWNAGHLPIRYKLESDLFPVNNVDDLDGYSSVSNNDGYAQINLDAGYEDYSVGCYVNVVGTVYNGVYRIRSVVDFDQITIEAPYVDDDSGTLQKYYKDYHAKIKVYAGIPEYHPHVMEDPMSFVATFNVDFYDNDGTNEAIVDISTLVVDKILKEGSIVNDLTQDTLPNDLNAWTSFYIEYAEAYTDCLDGEEIDYVSDYIEDTYDGCDINFSLTNEEFTTDISGWTNDPTVSTVNPWIGPNTAWAWNAADGGIARAANLSLKEESYILKQDYDILQNVQYTWTFYVNYSASNRGNFFVVLDYGTATEKIVYQENTGVSGEYVVTFLADKGYSTIGFFARGVSLAGNVDIDCRYFQQTAELADPCRAYLFASNSVQQFQYKYGGSMGEYVMKGNNEVFLNKFLNTLDPHIHFDGFRSEYTFIISQSTFESSLNQNSVYALVSGYLNGTLVFIMQKKLVNQGDGVYRIDYDEMVSTDASSYFTEPFYFGSMATANEVDIQLYAVPSNIFTGGDFGTFETTTDPAGDPPSDWELTKVNAVNAQQDTAPNPLGSDALLVVYIATTTGEMIYFDDVTVLAGRRYEVKGTFAWDFSGLGTGKTVFKFGFSDESGLDIIYEDRQFDSDTLIQDDPYSFSMVFVNNTGSNLNLRFNLSASEAQGIGVHEVLMDNIQINGPYELISEVLSTEIDSDCANQTIHLTWLNSLGKWEDWIFKAEKDYSIEFGDSQLVKRDIYQDWDNGFINGETEGDVISIESWDKVTVRSQFVTLEQLEVLKEILRSIKVQAYVGDKKQTVIVDRSSKKIRTDGDKLYTIAFDINYPSKQIQRQ